MADFTSLKPIIAGRGKSASAWGNVAYALFVLLCFWTSAQLLNLLVHVPGVFEYLMQIQDSSRPRVEIGLAVGTLFGLIPFLAGCAILGVLILVLRWRRYF